MDTGASYKICVNHNSKRDRKQQNKLGWIVCFKMSFEIRGSADHLSTYMTRITNLNLFLYYDRDNKQQSNKRRCKNLPQNWHFFYGHWRWRLWIRNGVRQALLSRLRSDTEDAVVSGLGRDGEARWEVTSLSNALNILKNRMDWFPSLFLNYSKK